MRSLQGFLMRKVAIVCSALCSPARLPELADARLFKIILPLNEAAGFG